MQLQRLEEVHQELQKDIANLQQQRERLEGILDDKHHAYARLKTDFQQKTSELSTIENRMMDFDLKVKKAIEQLEAADTMKSRYEMDLIDLEILPAEALEMDEQYNDVSNLTMLESEIDQTKAILNNARYEKVNENAQQNYDVQKKEFDKKAADLANAEQLLESNTIRAKELEDRLETTINMFLTKIAFQRFILWSMMHRFRKVRYVGFKI